MLQEDADSIAARARKSKRGGSRRREAGRKRTAAGTLHRNPKAREEAPARAWDAVIIGSGIGGATLGFKLARAGLQVLVVERGDYLRIPREASGTVGRYIYHILRQAGAPLSFAGGESKFYGAALYRLRETDFCRVEHEAGISPAWPISYADLEPYYGEAEKLYKVHGALGGDPTEPPHAGAYPFPALPHHPLVESVIGRLKRSGVETCAIPRALDYGPGGKCVLCATCDAHYCRLDAKMDAETGALRPALATGNLTILTNTECLKVETDRNKATGVVLRDADGIMAVKAATVIVASGKWGTAPLLRRSRNSLYPEGLGNQGGALGRYQSGHSVGYVFPIMSLRALPPIHTKTMAINTYHDGAPGWPHPLGIIQAAGQMPFWEQAKGLTRLAAECVGRRSLVCFHATEALPTKETGYVFDGDDVVGRVEPVHNLKSFAKLRDLAVGAFRAAGYPVIARARPPYLWQEVGTACMGSDPTHSVVNPQCQVHGFDNLYVVDQTVLPSAGCVNTALTVVALAVRAADHIVGKQAASAASPPAALPHKQPA